MSDNGRKNTGVRPFVGRRDTFMGAPAAADRHPIALAQYGQEDRTGHATQVAMNLIVELLIGEPRGQLSLLGDLRDHDVADAVELQSAVGSGG